MSANTKVSVILTSCGRPDLLEKTLRSFFEFNTYPIDTLFIHEDLNISDEYANGFQARIKILIPPTVSLSFTYGKIGQIKALDAMMQKATGEYVFGCEDDFEFYAHGFIEKSIEILESNPKVINVWLRSVNDTNGHPVERPVFWSGSTSFSYLAPVYRGIWHGFTFNPGVRRKSDYNKLGSYSAIATFNPKHPAQSEAIIGKWYFRQSYRAVIIDGQGFVKHIGDNRGIRS